MEREHLGTRAAEPYRDPGEAATGQANLAARRQAQAGGAPPSTNAWRRRWGLKRTA
jgi:tRNA U34 5-methylaminomethyl-2-thiouridine-forming methyltransferase MnmC